MLLFVNSSFRFLCLSPTLFLDSLSEWVRLSPVSVKWREDVGVAVEMRGAVSIPVSVPSYIVFVHFLPTPHGILSNSCPLVLVLFLNTQPVPTGPSLSLPAPSGKLDFFC